MKTTSNKPKTVKKMSSKERLKQLKMFVSLCFTLCEDRFTISDYGVDFKEIANASTLSLSTIKRLARGEFSLNVRYGTIQAFGLVAGVKLIERHTGYQITVVD